MGKKMCYTSVNGINLDRDSIVMNGVLSQGGQSMLIDGVLEFQPDTKTGVSITAYRHLTEDDHVFEGHFPGKPVCPGHILLQMCNLTAQLFLFCLSSKKVAMPKSIRVKEVTNRQPAVPGDTLYVTCIDPEINADSFTCTAFIKNQHGKTVVQVDQLTLSTEEFDPKTVEVDLTRPQTDFEYDTVNDIYLSASEIVQNSLLPHRGQAMLIDGITAFQSTYQHANITAVSIPIKDVHFSGVNFCQGHLMLEMAYLATAMFHYCLVRKNDSLPAPMRTENIEVLRPALPGEILYVRCKDPEPGSRAFTCAAEVLDRNSNPVIRIGRIKGISLR